MSNVIVTNNKSTGEDSPLPTILPINLETGEVAEGYIVRSPKQQEYIAGKVQYNLREKESHWVASYHDTIRKATANLTLSQAGAVIKLIPYMRFKAQGLLVKDGKPLTTQGIQKAFKLEKKASSKLLRALQEEGVIITKKNGRSNEYYIAEEFHTMGYVVPGLSFTKIYQRKLSQIVEGMPANDVGILYKVLPYFHFREFYLVSNPDELDVTKLEYLSREELAHKIGHEPETISRMMRKLRGKGAILTTRDGNTSRYICHPDLVYRMQYETEWVRSVRKLFEAHDK